MYSPHGCAFYNRTGASAKFSLVGPAVHYSPANPAGADLYRRRVGAEMHGAVRQKHKAPAFTLCDRRDPRKLLRRRKLVGTQYSKLIASDGRSSASQDLRTYSRQLRLDFAIPDHGRDAMLVPASATMYFVGIAQECAARVTTCKPLPVSGKKAAVSRTSFLRFPARRAGRLRS